MNIILLRQFLYVTVAVVCLSVIVVVFYLGSQRIREAEASCHASGGVYVRVYDGFACVQPCASKGA
jgi:hypothetical protein